MKIGVMMCALQERRMIVPAIRQFDDTPIDEVIVACSRTSWNGGMSGDDTAELAVRAGATARLFDWKDEKDQKNWIMDKMKDKDWVLLFAPDMYMEKAQIHKLVQLLTTGKDRAYGCAMETYYKDYFTVLRPAMPFNNVAIRPRERFEWSSKIENFAYFPILTDVTMHHLSFVRTEDEMDVKLKTWSHADEVKGNFFEKWKEGHKVFIHGEDQPMEKYCLPEELQILIRTYENKSSDTLS